MRIHATPFLGQQKLAGRQKAGSTYSRPAYTTATDTVHFSGKKSQNPEEILLQQTLTQVKKQLPWTAIDKAEIARVPKTLHDYRITLKNGQSWIAKLQDTDGLIHYAIALEFPGEDGLYYELSYKEEWDEGEGQDKSGMAGVDIDEPYEPSFLLPDEEDEEDDSEKASEGTSFITVAGRTQDGEPFKVDNAARFERFLPQSPGSRFYTLSDKTYKFFERLHGFVRNKMGEPYDDELPPAPAAQSIQDAAPSQPGEVGGEDEGDRGDNYFRNLINSFDKE